MDKETVSSKLVTFFTQETNFKERSFFQPDTDLRSLGILDSLTLMSLAAFCEKEFGCELPLNEMGEDELQSIDKIGDAVLALARK